MDPSQYEREADDRTKQLDIAVNAGVMAWLRELGIDPDNPPEEWQK